MQEPENSNNVSRIKLAHAVALLTYIRKILGSNPGRNSDYLTGATHGTPQSIREIAGIII
jgi:hypothetical protein